MSSSHVGLLVAWAQDVVFSFTSSFLPRPDKQIVNFIPKYCWCWCVPLLKLLLSLQFEFYSKADYICLASF